MNSWVESGLTGSGLQWVIETGLQTKHPLDTPLSPVCILKMETSICPHAKLIWSGGNRCPLSPVLFPLLR